MHEAVPNNMYTDPGSVFSNQVPLQTPERARPQGSNCIETGELNYCLLSVFQWSRAKEVQVQFPQRIFQCFQTSKPHWKSARSGAIMLPLKVYRPRGLL